MRAATEGPRTPALEPVAVDGCDVCAALAGQREDARRLGGAPTVEHCNAELRSHSDHARPARWRTP
ncbi:hypothetical protein OG292_16565 [Streptomyces sp. NBC_01511]|uniref:hypothetical protein n=1 Tax=unclassified Streptomyces TaxID=2593676 RepID=UPI0038693F75